MRITYLRDHPNYVGTVAEWLFSEFFHLNPASVEQRMKVLRQSGRNQIPTTVVAIDESQILGTASLIESERGSGREDLSPWLARVYVDPEHRRKGVGASLVRRIVQEARLLEQPTLYLYTTDQERFYSELGWSVLERTTYLGHSIVIMETNPGS